MKVKELIQQLTAYDMNEDVDILMDVVQEKDCQTFQTTDIDFILDWHGTPLLVFEDWRKETPNEKEKR